MENNIKTKKIIFPLMLFILILFGCTKEEEYPDYKITNGHYQGRYIYQNKGYGYIIRLENHKYEEIIPGGVFYKKDWYCISAGTYFIDKNKLVFELDSMVYDFDPAQYQCNIDCFLPGEYTITYLNSTSDTLYFERGENENKIEYRLIRND